MPVLVDWMFTLPLLHLVSAMLLTHTHILHTLFSISLDVEFKRPALCLNPAEWTSLFLRTVGTTIGELLKGAKQSTCHSMWSTLFVTSNLPPQFLPQGPEKYFFGVKLPLQPPYVDPSATAMFTLYELMCFMCWQCCCLLLLLDLMAIINSSCGFCYCAIWVWITRGQLSCQCNHCLQTTFEAFHCTFNSFNELSSRIPVCHRECDEQFQKGEALGPALGLYH